MKKNKPRRTLAKQIEAAPDIETAKRIAKHGADPTKAEMDVFGFLGAEKNKMLLNAVQETIQEVTPKNPLLDFDLAGELKRIIAKKLLASISDRDSDTIQKISGAVKKPPGESLDKKRADILLLKTILETTGLKKVPTAEQLAMLLNIQTTADGHAALRRLCKKLKFPLAPAKRGPKKSSQYFEKRKAFNKERPAFDAMITLLHFLESLDFQFGKLDPSEALALFKSPAAQKVVGETLLKKLKRE